MKSYEILTRIAGIKKKILVPGDIVELSADDAAALVACGAVKLIASKPKPAEKGPADKKPEDKKPAPPKGDKIGARETA